MVCKPPQIDVTRENFDAVLFDLDGVVTRTAKVHAASWKRLFDEYLEKRAKEQGISWIPFDSGADYNNYVDGKPRYDGVKSFLESRGIDLPFGSKDDPPDAETVCGLGNRKNEILHEHLERHGVEVYRLTVVFLRLLRERGFRTAIVSSSKNCRPVLQAAGIEDLFDTRVDGVVSEQLSLNGKPQPDIFLEAARRLQVLPERAIVLEDAISGVQAGRRGKFGTVIGVDRVGQAEALKNNGADFVVSYMSELSVAGEIPAWENDIDKLPLALNSYGEIEKHLAGRRPFVALDYDGTLTPIVESPNLATLSDDMRRAVSELAEKCSVAVISGRDLPNVRKLVDIDRLIYAGSHGFDISGPTENGMEYQQGTEFLPVLDEAENALRPLLFKVDGAQIERKKFSIAVHYRKVKRDREQDVEEAVDQVLAENTRLRKKTGKKIFELQPDIDWNKGKALCWLLDILEMNRSDILPIYIGDDVTDEDAFRELQAGGLGILVNDDVPDSAHSSRARYRLKDCREVRTFLEKLTGMLQEKR